MGVCWGPLAPGRHYRPADAARPLGITKQAIDQATRQSTLEATETPAGRRVRGEDVLAGRDQRRPPEEPRREW